MDTEWYTDVYALRMFKEPVFGINCFKSIKQIKWIWCKSAIDKIQLYPSFVLEFKYYQEISFQMTKFWYLIQLTWDSGLKELFVCAKHPCGLGIWPIFKHWGLLRDSWSSQRYPFSHTHGSVESHPDNPISEPIKSPKIYHFAKFRHWKVTRPQKESSVFNHPVSADRGSFSGWLHPWKSNHYFWYECLICSK